MPQSPSQKEGKEVASMRKIPPRNPAVSAYTSQCRNRALTFPALCHSANVILHPSTILCLPLRSRILIRSPTESLSATHRINKQSKPQPYKFSSLHYRPTNHSPLYAPNAHSATLIRVDPPRKLPAGTTVPVF